MRLTRPRFRPLIAAGVIAVGGCTSASGPTGPVEPTMCSIPASRIFDGGVGRNGIPALLNPELVPPGAANASYLADDDRVIGIVIGGQAVAVPHRILWWHEIVNLDFPDGRVAVTYCPLTGSSMVFDRAGIEGDEFIVSGVLFENNLMMLDLPSESLWPQMSRGARCGPRDGASLSMVPAIEMTWSGWQRLYPSTLVVSDLTGWPRDYEIYPYGDYERVNNPTRLFPGSPLDTRRAPKERVLGIPAGTGGLAVPLAELTEAGAVHAVNATVGNESVVVFWDADAAGAAAFRTVAAGQSLTFEVSGAAIVDVETGSRWRVDGLAFSGPLTGEQLAPVAEAYTAFWFAWAIFQPATEVWESS